MVVDYKMTERERCPRCGKPGSGPYIRLVKGNPYLYFAHPIGHARVKWCYLRPNGVKAEKTRRRRASKALELLCALRDSFRFGKHIRRLDEIYRRKHVSILKEEWEQILNQMINQVKSRHGKFVKKYGKSPILEFDSANRRITCGFKGRSNYESVEGVFYIHTLLPPDFLKEICVE
jgi:hypothetical protein